MVIKSFNEAYYNMLEKFMKNDGTFVQYSGRTKEHTRTMLNQCMTFHTAIPPVLTLRHINIKACIAEAEWFMSGSSDVNKLEAMGCNFYRYHHFEDTYGNKSVGNYVGYMLRRGPHGDQLMYVINQIKELEGSRRAVINLFSPLEDAILPSCIVNLMFTRIGSELHMTVNYRSADFLVGFPNDMLSMYVIGKQIAAETGTYLKTMHVNFNNVHIYQSQYEDAVVIYNRVQSTSDKVLNMKVDIFHQPSIDEYNELVYRRPLKPVE